MVRCADCGFLAVQNYTTRALEEVELGIREEGSNPDMLSSMLQRAAGHEPLARTMYKMPPVCFVRAADIRGECNKVSGTMPHMVKSVIWQERKCTSFVQWLPGCSPKEHQRNDAS